MNSKRIFGLLLAATVIAVAAPFASSQARGGGMYNPSTETTVSGTVEKVNTISGAGRWGGTHLDLKTESGILDIHLGPSDFLSSKGFQFAPQDRIQVTGSKVTYQGHPAIIAREVKAHDKVLTLRNAQGIPEWAGGRRGGMAPGSTAPPTQQPQP